MKADSNYAQDNIDENKTLTTEASKNTNRKAVENFIIKYIGKIVTGNENVNLYKEMFNKMSDTEFDNFMKNLRDGKATLSVIIPNNSKTIKVNVENNFKIAKELGYDFFQQLNVGPNEDVPGYVTPNKYMIIKLPIRRAAQLLTKKISIPQDSSTIDMMSGQVTNKSKGSKITNPELQILLGLGLNDSLKELMKIRGGDLGASEAMNGLLVRNGDVSQEELEKYSTGVVSKKTLKSYLEAMHIRSTL